MKVIKEWGNFEESIASVVEKQVEFAGKVWKPNRKLAYVVASLCHPLPVTNSKDRSFTAATLANSAGSAHMQMCDFEHRLEYYGAEQDEIVGAIAAVEFPEKEKAIELASAGEKVPMKVLMAIWRKAAGVESALEDIGSKSNPWRTSMECEFDINESALHDGKTFYKFSTASDEMKDLVKKNSVDKWNGKKMSLAMGGEDGHVLFTGGALTRWPADKGAIVHEMAASDPKLFINTGWKNQSDWMEAVSTHRSVQEKSGISIGQTAPAEDGHTHEIAYDLSILTNQNHSHYLRLISFDPKSGILEGITSAISLYDSKLGTWTEHFHKIRIGPVSADASASMSVVPAEAIKLAQKR